MEIIVETYVPHGEHRRRNCGGDRCSVVHDDGQDTFEATCVEGEHFPPTRSGKGAHLGLKYAATHSHKHGEPKAGAKPGSNVGASQSDILTMRL
ncbi:hypothetical protein [Paraburkholderia xenovorans]|uniref:hypothetical protein n=1 Tax=Paraburkholderia xenovorans TaxID=36873 RepID=UPI0038BA39D2